MNITKRQIDKEIQALGAVLKILGELDDQQRSFVFKTVVERFKLAATAVVSAYPCKPSINDSSHDGKVTDNPKDFLAMKNPRTDAQKVACLAYFLTKERKQVHFKTGDIQKINTEAAGNPFSNASVAVDNAYQHSQFLTKGSGGKKQITNLGERIVEALPDQIKVKEIISQIKPKAKGRKKIKGKK